METELLKIFNEKGIVTGTATRAEVHRKGYWHETFHCWFISKAEGKNYIYFQLRSKMKKDYPDLLDITAAGHLLAHESTEDGVREVEEEIGIHVSIIDLMSLGILKYEAIRGELIDRELAHTYVYEYKKGFEDFQLQSEEVAGMYRADFTSFSELVTGDATELPIEGFELNEAGEKVKMRKNVTITSFVPHEEAFYRDVVNRIQAIIC
ncbi:NUDIX hydrolase [Bacillus sp. BGMRC 2118]|nr:NUDIX hydrolase [Bacillus sp. BGMRC 2118]